MMTLAEFIEKFTEAVEIEDASLIQPETKFRELEEWNSLSTLGVIAMVDEELGYELDPDTLKQASTVEDIFNILSSKCK